jgi:hypothetical protein
VTKETSCARPLCSVGTTRTKVNKENFSGISLIRNEEVIFFNPFKQCHFFLNGMFSTYVVEL